MRVAQFGTFDVENFGDLLFPLLLKHRLEPIVHEFVFVSPVGAERIWGDCVPSVSVETVLQDPRRFDAIVLGGGNIIRGGMARAAGYWERWPESVIAYAELWSGAACLASRDASPLIWNAPGVVGPLSSYEEQLLSWAVSLSSYVSVRDEHSAAILASIEPTCEPFVVPDTALEVSRLWREDELRRHHAAAFEARGKVASNATVVFHVNSRYVQDPLPVLAARLDRIADTLGLTPVLLGLGPCHGDDDVALRVAKEMRSNPLVVARPKSLIEVVALVALASAYIGSSLHGLITATSFGVPGLVVVTEPEARGQKFTGFLKQVGAARRCVPSWKEVEEALELVQASGAAWQDAVAYRALDEHWQRIAEIIGGDFDERDSLADGGEPPSHEVVRIHPLRGSLIANGSETIWHAYRAMERTRVQLTSERNEQIDRLRRELHDQSRARRKERSEKRSLQNHVSRLEAIREELRQEGRVARREARSLKSVVDVVRQERARIKGERDDAQEAVIGLESDLVDARNCIERMRTEKAAVLIARQDAELLVKELLAHALPLLPSQRWRSVRTFLSAITFGAWKGRERLDHVQRIEDIQAAIGSGSKQSNDPSS